MTRNKVWLGALLVVGSSVYSVASFAHSKEAHVAQPLAPDCVRVLTREANLTDPVQMALRAQCKKLALKNSDHDQGKTMDAHDRMMPPANGH
jgi:hypothetical protein